MNMENIDLEALQSGLETFDHQRRQRGWLRRNWLWFVPTLFVVLVLLGGGGVYWTMFLHVYQLDVFRTAMQEINADEALQSELGQPITIVKWPPPAARLEAQEQDIRWPIEGPQGSAKAHVSARLMQGNWEIVQLEVMLADGKRLQVASSGGGATDAALFEAPEVEPQKPDDDTKAPPPIINLQVPPNDAPGM